MRKGVEEVIEAWKVGRSKFNPNVSTDGQNLFSYALKIGYQENGKLVVVNYVGTHSVTTSMHVNAAKTIADEIIEPSDVTV